MEDKNLEKEDLKGLQDVNKEDKNKKDDKDSYEKICYMCRRPESKAGPMISMPGGPVHRDDFFRNIMVIRFLSLL